MTNPYTLSLDQVYPWGRSFDEYVRMFALSGADLAGNILGVGDGPAAFNALATQFGHRVTSVDPLYRYSVDQIRHRIDETADYLLKFATDRRHLFTWTDIRSPAEMKQRRLDSMYRFLDDLPTGLHDGRYIIGSLPRLPLPDDSFDLALCSHFLFLYDDSAGHEFHIRAAGEMLRVAHEARIFPVLDANAETSRHLQPVMQAMHAAEHRAQLRTVDYEFQRRGNQLLVLQRT